ncbi:MAG: T9SS type A sorting domain-containing protein [Candidatus Delongbacteria bacterium]|jgi:hypothetical protein|nr:T9SS type A sorting domain-containing protein [Candidatus Delongbacteria bacterium]
MNTKLTIFITLIATFLLSAEDFWMKLNWDYPVDGIFYTSQNEIYINTEDSVASNAQYRSLDDGITWERLNTIAYEIPYISDDGNLVYYQGEDSLYVFHKDSTVHRSLIAFRTPFSSMNKCGDNFFFLDWAEILKSDENLQDTTLVLKTEDSEPFNAIVLDSVGTLWAGSTDYMLEGGLYKSTDNGDTWEGPLEEMLNHFIQAMAVDSEGRIFIGTAGHGTMGGGRVFRSEDNGETWQKVAGDGAYTWNILIDKDDDIFLGMSDDWGFLGVCTSSDHGDTWEFINEGLGGSDLTGGAGGIRDMAISKDGFIYLATDGGVFRSVKTTTSIDPDLSGIIDNYELMQNYPNPFNNDTNISFNIAGMSEVKLSVYNIKGEFVKNICNERLRKGIHKYSFKADDLNSGVYLYQLVINGKTEETKKMIYLR